MMRMKGSRSSSNSRSSWVLWGRRRIAKSPCSLPEGIEGLVERRSVLPQLPLLRTLLCVSRRRQWHRSRQVRGIDYILKLPPRSPPHNTVSLPTGLLFSGATVAALLPPPPSSSPPPPPPSPRLQLPPTQNNLLIVAAGKLMKLISPSRSN